MELLSIFLDLQKLQSPLGQGSSLVRSLVAFGADSVIELIAGGAHLWGLIIEARRAILTRVQWAQKISSWVGMASALDRGIRPKRLSEMYGEHGK